MREKVTHRETDRQRQRETDRQTDREAGRRDRQIDRDRQRQTDRQRERREGEGERQTDRQIETKKYREIDGDKTNKSTTKTVLPREKKEKKKVQQRCRQPVGLSRSEQVSEAQDGERGERGRWGGERGWEVNRRGGRRGAGHVGEGGRSQKQNRIQGRNKRSSLLATTPEKH